MLNKIKKFQNCRTYKVKTVYIVEIESNACSMVLYVYIYVHFCRKPPTRCSENIEKVVVPWHPEQGGGCEDFGGILQAPQGRGQGFRRRVPCSVQREAHWSLRADDA